jgi:hypothetical protein
LIPISANKRRKLVLTPDFDSYAASILEGGTLHHRSMWLLHRAR